MRQTHVGGDKLFVDYAGDTVPVIVDRLTGEVRQAQIFVAVMGASNFTYAEAISPTPRQCHGRLPDVIAELKGEAEVATRKAI
jgi:transposase